VSIIRWEDPPDGAVYQWDEIADALRDRPGEWALIVEPASVSLTTTLAYQIRNGYRPAFQPAGSFQAKAYVKSGDLRVYARYVGRDDTRTCVDCYIELPEQFDRFPDTYCQHRNPDGAA